MTYQEIESIAFAVSVANLKNGVSYLVAIKDEKGYQVASKEVAEKLGYDALAEVSIVGNKKVLKVMDVH